MSVVSPTVLPRPPVFPRLLPKPPQPHPTPLPTRRIYGHLNSRRDLQREMDDLSDEENEVEDINMSIRIKGYDSSIPIGRLFTQQQEKNDADESDDSDSGRSGGPPSIMDDGENDSGPDLDASMEDLDDDAVDTTVETDDPDEDSGSEEELSDA